MCSTPALIKSVSLPERCMEHSLWGQVHQAKSISFHHNQFCTVQELKPRRQDVRAGSDVGGENREGQGNLGLDTGQWSRGIPQLPDHHITSKPQL